MNKKISVFVIIIAVIAQSFSCVIPVGAITDNLCLDGDFEAYTDGTDIGDMPNGYIKFYGTNGNSAVYSKDAAYGDGSKTGAKIIRSSSGSAEMNCQLSSFDTAKTYQIDFDVLIDGPSWAGRFTMMGLPSYSWLVQSGEIQLTPNEWTHYSFSIGSEDTDYLFSSVSTSGGALLRLYMADNGTMYVDNFSVTEVGSEPTPTATPTVTPSATPTETNNSKMIKDGDFEGYTNNGEIAADNEKGYFKFYGTNGNTGVYSTEGAYGTDSKLGAKVVRNANGDAQLNCEVNNIDTAKTYQIDFDVLIDGPSWAGRFAMMGLPSYSWLMQSGEIQLTPNEWTHYSFTIGSEDTDYLFSSVGTDGGALLRLYMADNGTMYVDNFSVTEVGSEPTPTTTPTTTPTGTDNSKMIKDGDFESYTNGDAVSNDAENGYCKFYGTNGNTAIYSTEASDGKNGNLGVKMVREFDGEAQFTCQVDTLDTKKTYQIDFDILVDGPSWAGRFTIMGLPSYGWLITQGEIQITPDSRIHYSFSVGPEGDYSFSNEDQSKGAIIRFYLADKGTMFIDNFFMKEASAAPTATPIPTPTPTPTTEKTHSSQSGLGGGSSSAYKNPSVSSAKTSSGGYISKGNASALPIENEKIFNDIDNVEWAKDSIEELYKLGIISGKENKIFAPDEFVTREQFIKMLVNAVGLKNTNTENTFKDVSTSEWYYSYIMSAVSSGIIYGIEDDIFGIGLNVSREDMAVFTTRAIGCQNEISSEPDFSDKDMIADYAVNSVATMNKLGLLEGNNNEFLPKKYATRAEAAVLINKIREYLNVKKG